MNNKNHTRRRLFTRQKADLPPLGITPRDLRILKLLHEYRFLNTPQIQALVGGSKRNVSERLLRLFHHGYLDRPPHQRELRTDGYRYLIYALSYAGARLLSERLGDDRYLSRHLAASNKGVKSIHLAHALMISQFRACLTLACRARGDLTLVSWETPAHALMQARVSGHRVPVIPDGRFVLTDADGHVAHFFLEADRGTMTHNRFLSKLKAYWRYRAIGAGPRAFRVLTITPSPKRAENLTKTAKAADPKGKGSLMFYFACEHAYRLDRPMTILAPIWRSPADDNLHSLLEGKPQKELIMAPLTKF